MSKNCVGLVIPMLAFFSVDASALSCGIGSEQALVDGNDHIFLVLVTSAEFVRANEGSPGVGTVVARFEVIETLKGDPEQVPHIEAKVYAADESWPAQVYLGRRYLVFSDDGPATFTACSDLYRDHGREEWCLEYQIRKRLGLQIDESRTCEAAYLRREMNRRSFKPESARDDLEGLRLEWAARFGALPD